MMNISHLDDMVLLLGELALCRDDERTAILR
jgi:hypothetical protein